MRAAVDLRARRVPRVEDGAHARAPAARARPAGTARPVLVLVDLLEGARPARAGRRRSSSTSCCDAARGLQVGERLLEAVRRRRPRRPRRTSGSAAGTSRRRSARCRSLAASPSTASSFRPRLRIVSIIPGIEIAAPERTETSSGFVAGRRSACPSAARARDVLCDLLVEPAGQLLAGRHVGAAGVGRDREARRAPARRAASSRPGRRPCRRAARGRPRTASSKS